jgi:glutamyl/glutaminyl-tRNA synthetase
MPHLSSSFNKTRIAPTPSGYLHLGNILSFAITAFLARKNDSKILLRIDDLDQARVNKLYLQDIFDTLNFLEIPWDEGPRSLKAFEADFSQLHRMPLYLEAFEQLADKGLVFACSCSRNQLVMGECSCIDKKTPLSTQNISWRLITSTATEIEVKNYNGDVIRAALPAEMEHVVLKKKDSLPAYQLTSVIDDLFFGVDFVIRGDDLWPSTLAQHVLANALGENPFSDIKFYHHSLLRDEGEKLSKSAGATSIRYLRESGKKPADIYRIIAGMMNIRDNIISWEQLGRAVTVAMKL